MMASANFLQIDSCELADEMKSMDELDSCSSKLLLVDCRRFLEYNTSHIRSAINICCPKILKRRIKEDKASASELVRKQLSTCGLISECVSMNNMHLVLYDHTETLTSLAAQDGGKKGFGLNCGGSADECTLLTVLIDKLTKSNAFKQVSALAGGFVAFQQRYPTLCEGAVPAAQGLQPTPGRGCSNRLSMTSLSQPCLPVTAQGPTRILPFLYLGSQQDAMSQETMQRYGIDHVLNLSRTCPRPPHVVDDSRFTRIAVNDSYTEKLLPHFALAFQFLERVQECKGCVLVHCLAGISRSPTVAIAFIMHHLGMNQEEAYRFVKEKRPSISPNFNFMGQLLEFEKELTEKRQNRLKESGGGKIKNRNPPLSSRISMETKEVFDVASTSTLPNVCEKTAAIFKRSLSCPIKLSHKTSFDDVIVEVLMDDGPESGEPSCIPNVNGKREMESPVRPCSPPCPGGLLSAPLCCVPTVNQDLPSPSTEFNARLSLDGPECGAPPFSGASTFVDTSSTVQMRSYGPFTAPYVGTEMSAINPFFSSYHSSSHLKSPARHVLLEPSLKATNPFFPPQSSDPTASPKIIHLGPKRRKEETKSRSPSPKWKKKGVGNRFISQLLGKRLQWSRLCSPPQQQVSFINTVCMSSTHGEGLNTHSGLARLPVKSRSESTLLMDSPESGFVDQASPVSDKTIRDPDRDSISSHSSMEIAVN